MTKLAVQSHLIHRQTDPAWLKRTAIEEFIIARNSKRMIAYVGSFASEHLGYKKWSAMWESFYETLDSRSQSRNEELSDFLKSDMLSSHRIYDDATTTADLLEHIYRIDAFIDKKKFGKFRKEFLSKEFSMGRNKTPRRGLPNIIGELYERLKIDRFLTTNYDLEIELELMSRFSEREGRSPKDAWRRLTSGNTPLVVRDGDRLSRYISGRGIVVSDIAEREQYQRLVEFSLRQPSYRAHILHLHGRVDASESALVTRRDYRDRYLQDVPTRLPFNFATRQLFLGNPILFVGLGAKEPDVMRTLEEHLSNNPNRRDTATFLLWSSSKNEVEDNAKRIWFYRQYGVHILFDHEIARLAGGEPIQPKNSPDRKMIPARRMTEPLRQLAKLADDALLRGRWEGRTFRSASVKYGQPIGVPPGQPTHVRIWQLEGSRTGSEPRFEDPDAIAREMTTSPNVKLVTAKSGVGRGSCAAALADAFLNRYRAEHDARIKAGGQSGEFRVISANGAFTTELDSVFSVLSGAYDRKTADKDGISRFAAVEKLLRTIQENADLAKILKSPHVAPPASVTIIINGAERFIAHDGTSLSNELDNLVRRMLEFTTRNRAIAALRDAAETLKDHLPEGFDFPINLILLGTDRVQRYLNRLNRRYDHWKLDDQHTPIAKPEAGKLWLRPASADHGDPGMSHPIENVCPYFDELVDAWPGLGLETTLDRKMSDRTLRRQTLFKAILEPDALAGAGIENVALAWEILRVLAFIGQPTEPEVLSHLPYVVEAGDGTSTLPKQIDALIERLIELKLILKIEHFDPSLTVPEPLKNYRLGLNKALTMELRERYGVPLTESRLSASFNLSLFAAQPFENYVPDNNWHDELGHMVDWLIGSSRTPSKIASTFPAEDIETMSKEEFWTKARDGTPNPDGTKLIQYYDEQRLIRMIGPETSYCLRAALALLRGYYSVPALLMQDNRTLDPMMRDGPLTEYAERLTRLIRIYEDVAIARTTAINSLGHSREKMGPPPLYADDLLWIHNELGVARLTQGNLYGARAALEQAIRINRQYVEFEDRQQNWCRLELNSVFLDIERGKIGPAEERLRDIESAINEQAHRINVESSDVRDDGGEAGDSDPALDRRYVSPVEEIIRRYAIDRKVIDAVGADDKFPTDLILSTALVLGYRGICLHLRGSLVPALQALNSCLRMLQRLGEQRAYSFFQRHVAGVHHSMGKFDLAKDALKLCIAAAGPTRHPDIDHDGRIALIQYGLNCDFSPRDGQERIPQLMATRQYARASDMYRLQMEAAQTLALVHLSNGDHDSALRYASDALSIAARNGIALRKISLRILLGRVASSRGDRVQALELINAAIVLATRIGYERAVETAENARIELEGG